MLPMQTIPTLLVLVLVSVQIMHKPRTSLVVMLVVVPMLHLFQTFLEVTRGLVRLMLDKLYLSVQRQVVMLQILKIVFLLGLVLDTMTSLTTLLHMMIFLLLQILLF